MLDRTWQDSQSSLDAWKGGVRGINMKKMKTTGVGRRTGTARSSFVSRNKRFPEARIPLICGTEADLPYVAVIESL